MVYRGNDADKKAEVLTESIPLPVCPPKTHMQWSGIEKRPLCWQASE